MDRVTQLQDGIDQYIQIFFAGLDYVHRSAAMTSVNPQFPVTKKNSISADSPEAVEAKIKEIAKDIAQQAKHVDALIRTLPQPSIENVDDSAMEIDTDKDEGNLSREVLLAKIEKSKIRQLQDKDAKCRDDCKRLRRAIESADVTIDKLSKAIKFVTDCN